MKRFLISFLLTSIILVFVIFYFQYEVMDFFDMLRGEIMDPEYAEAVNQYTADDGREELVVLLMGVDRDPDRSLEDQGLHNLKEKGEQVEDKLRGEQYFPTGRRSDTIYLCKYNKRTGKIDMISIPRDTKTEVTYRGYEDKINAAFSLDGPYGALETVRNFTGVDVEYFVVFDYDAVALMVDKIGGVEVDVPFRMEYDDPTDNPPLHIDLQPGVQTLNGEEALGFCRWRHNNDYSEQYEEGDVGRVNTQQYFLKQFVKQATSARNLPRMTSLATTMLDNTYTNLPMVEVFSAAASAPRIDLETMETYTVPGQGMPGNGGPAYFIADTEAKDELFREVFANHMK